MKFTNTIEAQEGIITAGLKWRQITGISAAYAVCYGNGSFVCASQNGKIYYSFDGYVWGESDVTISIAWKGICYGNGQFVAFADTYLATSYNGTNWTVTPTTMYGHRIYYLNNMFYISADWDNLYNCHIHRSTDAVTWFSSVTSYRYSFMCGGGQILVAYDNGDPSGYAVSTDQGTSWNRYSLSDGSSSKTITYFDGYFYHFNNTIKKSSDGIIWENVSTIPSAVGYGNVVHVGGITYGIGAGKTLNAISNDFKQKKALYSFASEPMSMCYGNGIFVVALYNGTMNVSGSIANTDIIRPYKGIPGGVCELDATAKVPLSRLPDDYTGLDITRIIGGSF